MDEGSGGSSRPAVQGSSSQETENSFRTGRRNKFTGERILTMQSEGNSLSRIFTAPVTPSPNTPSPRGDDERAKEGALERLSASMERLASTRNSAEARSRTVSGSSSLVSLGNSFVILNTPTPPSRSLTDLPSQRSPRSPLRPSERGRGYEAEDEEDDDLIGGISVNQMLSASDELADSSILQTPSRRSRIPGYNLFSKSPKKDGEAEANIGRFSSLKDLIRKNPIHEMRSSTSGESESMAGGYFIPDLTPQTPATEQQHQQQSPRGRFDGPAATPDAFSISILIPKTQGTEGSYFIKDHFSSKDVPSQKMVSATTQSQTIMKTQVTQTHPQRPTPRRHNAEGSPCSSPAEYPAPPEEATDIRQAILDCQRAWHATPEYTRSMGYIHTGDKTYDDIARDIGEATTEDIRRDTVIQRPMLTDSWSTIGSQHRRFRLDSPLSGGGVRLELDGGVRLDGSGDVSSPNVSPTRRKPAQRSTSYSEELFQNMMAQDTPLITFSQSRTTPARNSFSTVTDCNPVGLLYNRFMDTIGRSGSRASSSETTARRPQESPTRASAFDSGVSLLMPEGDDTPDIVATRRSSISSGNTSFITTLEEMEVPSNHIFPQEPVTGGPLVDDIEDIQLYTLVEDVTGDPFVAGQIDDSTSAASEPRFRSASYSPPPSLAPEQALSTFDNTMDNTLHLQDHLQHDMDDTSDDMDSIIAPSTASSNGMPHTTPPQYSPNPGSSHRRSILRAPTTHFEDEPSIVLLEAAPTCRSSGSSMTNVRGFRSTSRSPSPTRPVMRREVSAGEGMEPDVIILDTVPARRNNNSNGRPAAPVEVQPRADREDPATLLERLAGSLRSSRTDGRASVRRTDVAPGSPTAEFHMLDPSRSICPEEGGNRVIFLGELQLVDPTMRTHGSYDDSTHITRTPRALEDTRSEASVVIRPENPLQTRNISGSSGGMIDWRQIRSTVRSPPPRRLLVPEDADLSHLDIGRASPSDKSPPRTSPRTNTGGQPRQSTSRNPAGRSTRNESARSTIPPRESSPSPARPFSPNQEQSLSPPRRHEAPTHVTNRPPANTTRGREPSVRRGGTSAQRGGRNQGNNSRNRARNRRRPNRPRQSAPDAPTLPSTLDGQPPQGQQDSHRAQNGQGRTQEQQPIRRRTTTSQEEIMAAEAGQQHTRTSSPQRPPATNENTIVRSVAERIQHAVTTSVSTSGFTPNSNPGVVEMIPPPSPLTNVTNRPSSSGSSVVILTTQRSTKCPITRREFVEPVISPCGHSFEKSALERLFKNHKERKKGLEMPCPAIGCNESFREEQVNRDCEMERTL